MNNKNERGFFDEQFRLEKLASKEDPLVKPDKVIRREDFRSLIDSAYSGDKCKSLIRRYKMKDKVHEKGYRNNPLKNMNVRQID